jgi:hypothetical protein
LNFQPNSQTIRILSEIDRRAAALISHIVYVAADWLGRVITVEFYFTYFTTPYFESSQERHRKEQIIYPTMYQKILLLNE